MNMCTSKNFKICLAKNSLEIVFVRQARDLVGPTSKITGPH